MSEVAPGSGAVHALAVSGPVPPIAASPSAPTPLASGAGAVQSQEGFPAAARSKRVVAALIDVGIAIGFMLLLLTLPTGLRAFMRNGFIFRILAFAPGLYLLLRDSFGGHSVGKLIVGLVVIDTRTHHRAGILESVLRNWPLALVGIPAIGWLMAGLAALLIGFQVLTGKKQRFMDGSATTQVIEERLLVGA